MPNPNNFSINIRAIPNKKEIIIGIIFFSSTYLLVDGLFKKEREWIPKMSPIKSIARLKFI